MSQDDTGPGYEGIKQNKWTAEEIWNTAEMTPKPFKNGMADINADTAEQSF